MIQIIYDNEIQSYIFNYNNIVFKDEENNIINKENKNINIDIDLKKKYYWNKEKEYIQKICNKLSIKNSFIKTSFGFIKKIDDFGNINTQFKDSNKLIFKFNDKLEIIMGGKKINIEELIKICEFKKIKMKCEFNFYSIIYKTQEKINITNRLKLSKIKILDIEGNENQIKKYNNLYEKTNYMIKKEAVSNIMKLLSK